MTRQAAKQVKLSINGRHVEVPKGTTILNAARSLDVRIPTLCHDDGSEPFTSCFVCVVAVEGFSTLVPSCTMQVADGMVVSTGTKEVLDARRTAVELLLSEHRGDCVAPCELACPARLDVAAMCEHLRAGRISEAVTSMRRRIPFNAILGRICPRFCERVCRRADLDDAVSIAALQRFAGDAALESEMCVEQPPSATGKSVAIVGAGPAGLTAAYYLLGHGHACTIFDANAEPGGMLRYGIDESRLPRTVLNGEVDLVRRLGGEFRMNSRLGTDISLSELRRDFDAVLTAMGNSIDTPMIEQMGFTTSSGKGIVVERKTFAAGVDGVFAAGGCVSGAGGANYAVRAVAAGRKAAASIDQYLNGEEIVGEIEPVNVRMGKLNEEEIAVLRRDAHEASRTPTAPAGLEPGQAETEARRCLVCSCVARADCKLRALATEVGARPGRFAGKKRSFQRDTSHPTVVYEPGKCVLCGRCVRITKEADEPFGLAFLERGFEATPGVPFELPLAEGLQVSAERVVNACPTGALAFKKPDNIS